MPYHVTTGDIERSSGDIVDALTSGEKIRLSKEAERELGKRDTFYLARYILGYDLIPGRHGFHRALCRFHDRYLYENQFHLHPRKHFKTTILTIAGKIRLMLVDPDITICLIASTVSNSENYLREIRKQIGTNLKFGDLYPEHVPRSRREEGTTDGFTTPARTKPYIRMQTFEVSGIDRAIVSRHYKLLNFDDMVDDKNINTLELRMKVYENYVASLSTASLNRLQQPWHHITGTRWHLDDMYSKIIADEKVQPCFNKMITSAYRKVRKADGTFESEYLFPEVHPPESLEALRIKQGDRLFSCLYLNNPLPSEDVLLNPEMIQYWEPSIPSIGPRDRVITVDPASSEEVRLGDPTVMSCFEMDGQGNIYLRECRRNWWMPEDIIQNLLDMVKLHVVRVVGIESVSFSKWLCFYLDKARKEQHLHFKIEKMKRDPRICKSKRIERLAPVVRLGKFFVPRSEPNLEAIFREFREYPVGRYDDFLDTAADAVELLRPPSTVSKPKNNYRLPPRTTAGRRKFQTGYSTHA